MKCTDITEQVLPVPARGIQLESRSGVVSENVCGFHETSQVNARILATIKRVMKP
jgi:hypothetical protein